MVGGRRNVVSALQDKPLYVQAYEELKKAILSGRIRPGEHLSQVKLAEQLNISRAPVLDALARLATEGLAEHGPRSGYFVKAFTVKDVADIYNVRRALECEALEAVFQNAEPEDIRALNDILLEPYDHLEQGDMAPYVAADDAFHTRLVELSGNVVLENLLCQLKDQTQLVRVMVAVSPQRVKRAAKEHLEILDSLLEGNLPAAREMLSYHIDSVKDEVIAGLRKKGQA